MEGQTGCGRRPRCGHRDRLPRSLERPSPRTTGDPRANAGILPSRDRSTAFSLQAVKIVLRASRLPQVQYRRDGHRERGREADAPGFLYAHPLFLLRLTGLHAVPLDLVTTGGELYLECIVRFLWLKDEVFRTGIRQRVPRRGETPKRDHVDQLHPLGVAAR